MARVPFEDLPDHGRLWVFPATRDLSASEVEAFTAAVDDFLASWTAHGVPLRSGRELRHRRYLLVGVDVDAEAPSGCSIDALVRRLKALGAELGVGLIDHAPVWFREGDEVRTVSRREFRGLVERGAVTPDIIVADTTLTRLRELREGGLERPAAETWHGKAFFEASQAG